MPKKILVVEDEEAMISFLQPMLKRAGFHVIIAKDGEQALTLADREKPDLIVLDIQLPKLNGWEVCKKLRDQELQTQKRYTPIIMLTVLDETIEKVKGLTMGADHYFSKSIDPHELIAQIEATLRTVEKSREASHPHLIICDDLEIDLDRNMVSIAGQPVALTPTEFKLLRLLAEQPGRVFGREMIVVEVHGWSSTGEVIDDARVVDRHIAEIRKKLEPNREVPQYILTVRGFGYKFRICEE